MTSGGPHRWLRVGLAAGFLVLIAPSPASAGVEGPCEASFNGVEVERIDSLSSPLELTIDDQLTFHGTDSTGTQNVSVELVLASLGIDEGTSTYGPPQNDFSASIDLEGISPYGVGLFRVRGTTDNCTAQAWVRVGGKIAVTTLTGITGLGLTLGGLTGQLAAIAARRRWAWLTAAVAGIATGFGGALLGQQFGRLQLSYVSIAIAVAAAAVAGALLALLFRPRPGPSWGDRRRVERETRRDEREEQRLRKDEARQRRDEEQAREAAGREQRDTVRPETKETPAAHVADRSPAESSDQDAAAEPTAAGTVSEAGGPYWCYVMSQVEVLDLAQPTRVIAVLQPGNWYLARREAGEWVHVVAGENLEGWAPRTSVHRHG
jgi:hypothetical protein